MIHEFEIKKFDPTYKDKKISKDDYILFFKDGYVFLDETNNIPKYNDSYSNISVRYLFNLNDKNYFFTFNVINEEYKDIKIYRSLDKELGFIIMSAYHLYLWYKRSNYCGCCSSPLTHSLKERAFLCPNCNLLYFPKISPFVIVLIKDTINDRIVVSKYNKKNALYALIAGFIEIGETPEDAVKREVFEEVGLNVKNIKYYSSQPWGITGGLALGYTCEVDGSLEIKLDTNELSTAKYLNRYDRELDIVDDKSLTGKMIRDFLNNII